MDDDATPDPADPSVCRCPCHRPDAVILHFFACCYPCERCGQRIRRGREAMHAASCPTAIKSEAPHVHED